MTVAGTREGDASQDGRATDEECRIHLALLIATRFGF